MKKIVWLASFPKSGNTWVRTLLTNLLNGKQEDTLNNLVAMGLSSREVLDEHMMLETSELTLREIDNYLPMAIRELANSIKSAPFFLKTHMAYTFNANNKPVYPADVSIGAIYLVRNVLDVVVSYAHHSNCSVDDILNGKTRLYNKQLSKRYQTSNPAALWYMGAAYFRLEKPIRNARTVYTV